MPALLFDQFVITINSLAEMDTSGTMQGHPKTLFRELSVRRSKNCVEFSIP